MRDALVAGAAQFFEQLFHRRIGAAFDLQSGGGNRAAFRRGLIETRARGDDDVRPAFAVDLSEERESFGRDFGIGENVFDRREFGFGQKLYIGKPIEDCFVKRILSPYGWAKDPNRFLNVPRDDGAEKCPGRWNDVGKF